MKILPLSEGTFTIDQSKVFVPFDPSADNLQERPRGSLLVEIQPFLVVTEKDLILFDSGLGYTNNGILQIIENLALYGFSSTDVTKVLMSHLHRDHAGGLIIQDTFTKSPFLTFPHAHHYINSQELAYAQSGKSTSYDQEYFSYLAQQEKVTLLNGKGIIDEYITYEMSSGHSSYHQVFWLKEKNELIFFGGDEAAQLQQMKTRFVAKYDADGKRAMELRQQWWEQGEEEHWTFLFYHDIKTPSIRL
ncbi:MAG: MBL fold metallo-hydrolase [Bacteroidota bacterium]|jgi:glyoxylase-like metal-dependent hydrolase (beta-lactamase superfamily II)